MERKVDRWARVVAWLGMLAMVVSCGTAQAATATTPMDRPLDQVIAAGMEGVQLDVWEGGAASPGRTTTLFVHHGDRAAMLYWKTDGWCLARVYTWSIEDAVSASNFEVRYVPREVVEDCVMASTRADLLTVVDVEHLLGGTTYRASWSGSTVTTTVRTKCTSQWDAAAPCGFAEAAALVPKL